MIHPLLLTMPARTVTSVSARLISEIRGEILAVAIGFMLLGLGLGACVAALARRRKADPALVSFSALCTLYAVRLLCDTEVAQVLYSLPPERWQKVINVLTYLMPVPAIFFIERVVGPGWRSSIRRMWQLNTALAAVAIPLEIASSSSGMLLGPYRVLVILSLVVTVANLFAPGRERTPDRSLLRASFIVLGLFALYENLGEMGIFPGDQDVEPIGFLLFVAGLGTIAARRVSASQERLAALHQELETARRIQESTLPGEPPRSITW